MFIMHDAAAKSPTAQPAAAAKSAAATSARVSSGPSSAIAPGGQQLQQHVAQGPDALQQQGQNQQNQQQHKGVEACVASEQCTQGQGPASTVQDPLAASGTAIQPAAGTASPGNGVPGGSNRPACKSAGAGDPAAFYASRVHAALGPHATPCLAAGQLPVAGTLDTGSGTGAEASAAPDKQDPGGPPVFEPMAGRVLLLGRRTRRLQLPQDMQQQQQQQQHLPGTWQRCSSGSSSGGAAANAAPSSSLASRAGVEKLSTLSGASMVASLPAQDNTPGNATQGSNPLLWRAVFGGAAQGAPAGRQVLALHGSLPRIRTKPNTGGGPVGEAAEGAAHPTTQQQGQQQPQQQQQQQQQRQQQQASQQPSQQAAHTPMQGAVRAGSLLLRGRGLSGTPTSLAAAAADAAAMRPGALLSIGSGPVSPSVFARYASTSGGPQLRSLELDRTAVAQGRRFARPRTGEAPAGRLPDGELQPGHGVAGAELTETPSVLHWEADGDADSSEGPAGAGLRLGVRWLDELVVALWVRIMAPRLQG